jgi:hypothetical protein
MSSALGRDIEGEGGKIKETIILLIVSSFEKGRPGLLLTNFFLLKRILTTRRIRNAVISPIIHSHRFE